MTQWRANADTHRASAWTQSITATAANIAKLMIETSVPKGVAAAIPSARRREGVRALGSAADNFVDDALLLDGVRTRISFAGACSVGAAHVVENNALRCKLLTNTS